MNSNETARCHKEKAQITKNSVLLRSAIPYTARKQQLWHSLHVGRAGAAGFHILAAVTIRTVTNLPQCPGHLIDFLQPAGSFNRRPFMWTAEKFSQQYKNSNCKQKQQSSATSSAAQNATKQQRYCTTVQYTAHNMQNISIANTTNSEHQSMHAHTHTPV